MSDAHDPLAIAQRLFAAIEAGDVEVVRALYANDIEVWHNTDRHVQSRDENLALLRWLIDTVDELRYDDIRREATPTGFVQQHVFVAKRRDGVRVEFPACVVARIEEGRIVRVDEYLDSAQIAPLLDR